MAVAIIGAVTVVLSANASDARLTPEQILEAISQTPFEAFACVYIIGAFVLVNLSSRATGEKYVLVDVGCCALFGERSQIMAQLSAVDARNRRLHCTLDEGRIDVVDNAGIAHVRKLDNVPHHNCQSCMPLFIIFLSLKSTGSDCHGRWTGALLESCIDAL